MPKRISHRECHNHISEPLREKSHTEITPIINIKVNIVNKQILMKQCVHNANFQFRGVLHLELLYLQQLRNGCAFLYYYEPQRDKTIKIGCASANTQVSLGISLYDRSLRFLQADSQDADQTRQMPRLIRVFAERTGHFVGLSCSGCLVYHVSCLSYHSFPSLFSLENGPS